MNPTTRDHTIVFTGSAATLVLAFYSRVPMITGIMLLCVLLALALYWFYRVQESGRQVSPTAPIHPATLVKKWAWYSSAGDGGPGSYTGSLVFKVPTLAPPGLMESFETEAEAQRWLHEHPTDLGERRVDRSFRSQDEAEAWIAPYQVGETYPAQQHPALDQSLVLVNDIAPPARGLYQLACGLVYLPIGPLLLLIFRP